MSAQSSREQETRDRFDSWSIGERAEATRLARGIAPLGKFGSAVDRVIRPIPLIAEMPVNLSDDFGRIPPVDREGE